jgi:drug/metabolite transporter (DMT)-like permease
LKKNGVATENNPHLNRAMFALAALSLIWGYNWVVMKKVLQYVGAFDFSAMRAILGALCLFAVLLWLRKPMRPVALKQTLLLGLLQTAAFTLLIQLALVGGGAGKVAVLTYTMPFWMLLLAGPLLNEHVRGMQWLAVAIAAGGLVFIIEPWKFEGSLTSSLLAATAGLVWAASAIVARRLRSRVRVDLLSLTAWQMLLGALVLVSTTPLVPSPPIVPSGYFIGALIFNSVMATGVAWLLWLYALDHLPANVASLSSLAVPAVGVLSAWIELGERPDGAEFAGMVLIALALALLALIGMRRGTVRENIAVE